MVRGCGVIPPRSCAHHVHLTSPHVLSMCSFMITPRMCCAFGIATTLTLRASPLRARPVAGLFGFCDGLAPETLSGSTLGRTGSGVQKGSTQDPAVQNGCQQDPCLKKGALRIQTPKGGLEDPKPQNETPPGSRRKKEGLRGSKAKGTIVAGLKKCRRWLPAAEKVPTQLRFIRQNMIPPGSGGSRLMPATHGEVR